MPPDGGRLRRSRWHWHAFCARIVSRQLSVIRRENTKKGRSEPCGSERPLCRESTKILDLFVYQTPDLIAEEHVDLSRFDDLGDLATAEFVVGHGLAFFVFTHSVVWRGIFAGAH